MESRAMEKFEWKPFREWPQSAHTVFAFILKDFRWGWEIRFDLREIFLQAKPEVGKYDAS